MQPGPRYSIRYLLAEILLFAVALGATWMLFVDGPLTQARIALVFPLFVCLSMSISGLAGGLGWAWGRRQWTRADGRCWRLSALGRRQAARRCRDSLRDR